MLDIVGGTTMRNRVINGCCRVKQRASVSLTTSNQFGEVDRMMGSYVNGSAGTFIQQVAGLASGMTFKRGVKFNDVTLSSGYITFRHRIEALNTLDLSGQTVTVSAKVYHDYGSSTNVKIGLRKPSASDNFASTSAIGTDNTVAVETGTTTIVSGTYTLGSTDADNGLEIVMYHDAKSVTTKNFVIGDIQLTLGTEVEQMERRSIGVEQGLCYRYFYKVGDYVGGAQCLGLGWVYGASEIDMVVPLPVTMRSTPTLVSTSGASYYYMAGSPNKSFNSFSNLQYFSGDKVNLYSTGLSGLTGGQAGQILTYAAGASVALSSEL